MCILENQTNNSPIERNVNDCLESIPFLVPKMQCTSNSLCCNDFSLVSGCKTNFSFMVVSFNGKENGLPKENNVPSVDHVRYMIESKIR